MRYEYLTTASPKDMADIDFLNQMGESEWKLVQVSRLEDGSPPLFYFMRVKAISRKLRKVQKEWNQQPEEPEDQEPRK